MSSKYLEPEHQLKWALQNRQIPNQIILEVSTATPKAPRDLVELTILPDSHCPSNSKRQSIRVILPNSNFLTIWEYPFHSLPNPIAS